MVGILIKGQGVSYTQEHDGISSFLTITQLQGDCWYKRILHILCMAQSHCHSEDKGSTCSHSQFHKDCSIEYCMRNKPFRTFRQCTVSNQIVSCHVSCFFCFVFLSSIGQFIDLKKAGKCTLLLLFTACKMK